VRTLLVTFLTLLGCQDYSMMGVEKRQPQMLVHPQEIDFGRLDAGTESGHETFMIINTGDEDLKIFAPDLVSGDARFEIDNYDEETITIAGGGFLEVNVYYTPETFETNGAHVSIEGNDELNPSTQVLLTGGGDAPVISVSPLDFDYGDISIGCDNEERITIRNTGNQDLIVNSVTQMVTQPADIILEMGSLPEPPWTIPPNFELDFLVSYVPSDIGTDASDIEIVSNDPINSLVETTQVGDGDVEQWHQDQFEQEEIPILDVLWVIDNSGSMSPFQSHLSANISSFMTVFSQSGADYHMAVITTDRSSFSTILTQNTPNVEQLLSSLVQTGTFGSGTERGIKMSVDSLSNSLHAGPGGSFFRSSAILVVIYVSDEADFSVPNWSSYIPFFEALKPAGDFLPYGVIGDVPGGCTYSGPYGNRTATAGTGYYDLIDYFGGNWYSICAQDWGVQLQNIANEVTNRKTFLLSQPDPIEDTIHVYVNGQLSTDWSFDSSANTVIFNDGYVPSEGQTITIDYALWGCDE